jgi:hypothetical protein
VANRCGSTRTWSGKKCRNKVTERGDACWLHTWLALLFRKGPPEQIPRQRNNRATSTNSSGRSKKDNAEYRAAAKVGKRVNGFLWRRRIAKRARHAVHRDTWALFSASSPSEAAASCRTLATIAQGLEDAKAEVQKQLAHLATSAMRNNSVIARKVADAIAKKVVNTVGYKVVIIIRSIRIAGVWVCAEAGRDLGSCRCLQALLRVEAPALVERQLRDGFKEFVSEDLELV